MSGLLTRLGAQATGSGWAVRSDARLPFGAARPAEAQAAATTGFAADSPASPDAQAPQRTPAAQRVAPPPGMTDAQDVTLAPTRAAGLAPDALPVLQPVAPPQTRQVLPADMLQPPTTLPDPLLRPAQVRPGPLPTEAVAPRGHDVLPRVAAGLPDPLLPDLPLSTRRPSASSARKAPAPETREALGMPRSGADTGQETEVHIHIGRIEVTALQEASSPKSKPRERTQPMSLDAYLAQRKGVQ